MLVIGRLYARLVIRLFEYVTLIIRLANDHAQLSDYVEYVVVIGRSLSVR